MDGRGYQRQQQMKFIKRLILILVLVGILAIPFVVGAQGGEGGSEGENGESVGGEILKDVAGAAFPPLGAARAVSQLSEQKDVFVKWAVDGIVQKVLALVSYALLGITAFFLWLAGGILNSVIQFTIVDAAKNIGTSSGSQGLFDIINEVWGVIRDLANIAFIFVLLYAAIRKIFGLEQNIGTVIKNVVIIGLMINFSLFLTKVVIDASNVVTVGFYDSIAASAPTTDSKIGASGRDVTGRTSNAVNFKRIGFAGIFMNKLGVGSIYSNSDTPQLGNNVSDKIAIVGFFGSLLMIVTTFVFLAMAIMLAIRYIVLIILMILSPLAFIAFIIPGLKGKWEEWWSALKDQAFFAPVFMAMMWIVIKIISSPNFLRLDATDGKRSFAATVEGGNGIIVFNFVLIIGFIIAALIFSKKIASSHGVGKLIGGAQKGVGMAVFGGTAFAGRHTIGKAASRLAKSKKFQQFAGRSAFGEKLHSVVEKTGKSSLDVRGSKILGKIDTATGSGLDLGSYGKAGGEGGFDKSIKTKEDKILKKGKSFTDKVARESYAKRMASKPLVKGGSASSLNSLAGMMGRPHRIAAATLLNERIKELQTEINVARGEVNNYRNSMGISGTAAAPTAAQLAQLSPYEQGRYYLLTSTTPLPGIVVPPGKSINDLSNDQANLRNDRSSLNLDKTTKQQY